MQTHRNTNKTNIHIYVDPPDGPPSSNVCMCVCVCVCVFAAVILHFYKLSWSDLY